MSKHSNRSTTFFCRAAALVAFWVLAAGVPLGQAQSVRGIFVNGHVGPVRAVLNDDDPQLGFGLGGRVGYGFSERVTLYFDFYGAGVEDAATERFPTDTDNAGLATADLGVQVFLPELTGRGPLVPYLTASYGGHMLAFDDGGDDDLFQSTGPTFGGGARYYTTANIALFADLRYTTGTFEEDADGDGIESVDLKALRVAAGVVAYPFR